MNAFEERRRTQIEEARERRRRRLMLPSTPVSSHARTVPGPASQGSDSTATSLPMADGSNAEERHHRFRWTTTSSTCQHSDSVTQGRICSDKCMCCHAEIEISDQTCCLTQSQYTDTRPNSPSAGPITTDTRPGLALEYQFFRHWYDSTQKNPPPPPPPPPPGQKWGVEPGCAVLRADVFTTRSRRRSIQDTFTTRSRRRSIQDTFTTRSRRRSIQDTFTTRSRRRSIQDTFTTRSRRRSIQDTFPTRSIKKVVHAGHLSH